MINVDKTLWKANIWLIRGGHINTRFIAYCNFSENDVSKKIIFTDDVEKNVDGFTTRKTHRPKCTIFIFL